jgi:hypothetical protein
MLAPGSAAVDTGASLAAVSLDRAGTTRPQGNGHDVGAYEAASAGSVTSDIVLHPAAQALGVQGDWQIVTDRSAASGVRLWHPDAGRQFKKSAAPVHYFEVGAWVEAGTPYRLWVRGTAQQDATANDSIAVQFAHTVTKRGEPQYRIGTTSAVRVILADCTECTVAGWGWQDNGFGVNKLGPLLRFDTSGPETIRIQTLEDGFSIDQIVLSPATYLTNPPGGLQKDSTILPMQ